MGIVTIDVCLLVELPWHKDSFHLAILPGLEVALLRGDVLHKVAGFVSANLYKHGVRSRYESF